MKNYERYVFVALVIFLASCTLAAPRMTDGKEMSGETPGQKAMESEAMSKGEWTSEQVEQMKKDEMMEQEHSNTMMSNVLSDGASKYQDWDKVAFDDAARSGKTIYLEFSANWCPICRQQEPELVAGFKQLNNPDVVGFKVHYKDDQTTDEHDALARQYQIAYQHTKVIIKDGKVVLKSPEAWNAERLVTEVNQLG